MGEKYEKYDPVRALPQLPNDCYKPKQSVGANRTGWHVDTDRRMQSENTASTTSLLDEALEHRTLTSSKKASAETLSTDVPGTDSAKTLLSSQKSLPPASAPTILPPLFDKFPANTRPPVTAGSSVIIPPEWKRL